MNAEPMIAIEGVTVDFEQGACAVRVLHGVDLTVARGESGCGKSVTWLAALKLLGRRARIGGRVMLGGQNLLSMSEREIARIRGKRVAMIFQDPTSSLNPVLRIGTLIEEAVRLHRGLSGAAARAEARRLLDRVGIADAARRLDQYPHELSGGMNQRVMIAIALAGSPDLLVADEPTTALDATIQAQILDILREIIAETSMSLVLISHDLGVVSDVCDRILVMYAGRIVEQGPTDALFEAPRHPYTRGLLGALPELEGPRRPLAAIPGMVPSPADLPPGCAFAPRCAYAADACRARVPPLIATGPLRSAACIRLDVVEQSEPDGPPEAAVASHAVTSEAVA